MNVQRINGLLCLVKCLHGCHPDIIWNFKKMDNLNPFLSYKLLNMNFALFDLLLCGWVGDVFNKKS